MQLCSLVARHPGSCQVQRLAAHDCYCVLFSVRFLLGLEKQKEQMPDV